MSALAPSSLLSALRAGVAVAAPEDWRVLFANEAFCACFPGDGPLDRRLPGLDAERARERLARGRPFAFEAEVRNGGKPASLAIELRSAALDGRDLLLVECRDVSKQKQAEYMLDSYAKLAERHARELQKEKERAEKLLLNVMPRSVYEEMREYGATTPQRFEQASVLMLDFVGFSELAASHEPAGLVAELNDIFSAFDRIVELLGCERIKTIGDGYVAVSGVPEVNPDHAVNLARAALRMRRYLERRNAAHSCKWRCRIGLSTGLLIGSIVGIQKYVYDVFGPAVNLAARLEALAEPMQIVMCEAFHALAREQVAARPHGEHELKGFGRRPTFLLEDELRSGR